MYTSSVLSPLCQRCFPNPSFRIQCRDGKCRGSPEAVHENPGNQECSRSNKISKRILSWPGSRATPAGYRGWINNKSRIILTSTYLLVLSAVLRVNAAASSRRLARAEDVVAVLTTPRNCCYRRCRETIKKLSRRHYATTRIFIRLSVKSLRSVL